MTVRNIAAAPHYHPTSQLHLKESPAGKKGPVHQPLTNNPALLKEYDIHTVLEAQLLMEQTVPRIAAADTAALAVSHPFLHAHPEAHRQHTTPLCSTLSKNDNIRRNQKQPELTHHFSVACSHSSQGRFNPFALSWQGWCTPSIHHTTECPPREMDCALPLLGSVYLVH